MQLGNERGLLLKEVSNVGIKYAGVFFFFVFYVAVPFPTLLYRIVLVFDDEYAAGNPFDFPTQFRTLFRGVLGENSIIFFRRNAGFGTIVHDKNQCFCVLVSYDDNVVIVTDAEFPMES